MQEFRADEPMTTEEMEAVMRRFQEGAHGGGSPHVSDVAEALGTSPEVVARLLSEVRQMPVAMETVGNVSQRRSVVRTVIAFAALAAGFLMGAVAFTQHASAVPPVVETPTVRASSWSYATPVPVVTKAAIQALPQGGTAADKGR
jgi:hypothetical protein